MIALIIALFVVTITGQAQSTYKSAIDLRVSDGYYDEVATSLKTFLSNPAAIELNIGFRVYGYIGYSWFNLSASLSFQYHFKIRSVAGLRWFIGGGATAFNTFSSY